MRLLILLSIICTTSCNSSNNNAEIDPDIVTPHVGINTPQTLTYDILNVFPHDTSAYTQGLEIYNGKMFESTGDYEKSSLRITNHTKGIVEKKHTMGTPEIFGEGITIFKNKIYQLTWESNVAYLYDINNIDKPIKTFNWPYEGWGITHDQKQLFVSDGSSNIYYLDPETFKVTNTISVRDDQGPVDNLNELEYVDGFIYANIYQTNFIVKIDAESGHVVGKLTMNGLLQQTDVTPGRTDVLNGIAYDSASKKFYITGKRWPKMFEITIK